MCPRISILIRCAIGLDLVWVNLSHPWSAQATNSTRPS